MVPQVFRRSRLSAFSCAAVLGLSATVFGSLLAPADAKPLQQAASSAEPGAKECPIPAVVNTGMALTPVTKANYARAETEVILTGRCKHPPAYFDLASVHSEMVCHKHYAERGVDLKRGVDY